LRIYPPARSPRRTDSGRDRAGEVGKCGKERQKFDGAVQEQVAGVPMATTDKVGVDRFGGLFVEEGPDGCRRLGQPAPHLVPEEVLRHHVLGKEPPQLRLVNASHISLHGESCTTTARSTPGSGPGRRLCGAGMALHNGSVRRDAVDRTFGALGLQTTPGMGEVKHLGGDHQVISTEAVAGLPAAFAIRVEPFYGDVVADAGFGLVGRDGGLDESQADFVDRSSGLSRRL